MVALLINIGVDLLGALPTIGKSYSEPEEESVRSWLIFLVADILNLGAIGSWTIASALYPCYLFALACLLVALMLRPTIGGLAGTAGCGP